MRSGPTRYCEHCTSTGLLLIIYVPLKGFEFLPSLVDADFLKVMSGLSIELFDNLESVPQRHLGL